MHIGIFLLGLIAMPLAAQSGLGFPVLGMAQGQSMRLTVLNEATPDALNPTSCNVTFQFLDASGKTLKQSVINIQPSTAAWIDLNFSDLAAPGLRVMLRPVVVFGYAGGANPPIEILQQSVCDNLTPTLELFDTASGKSSVVLTAARLFVPNQVPAP